MSPSSKQKEIKKAYWVLYCEEFPGGLIHPFRSDALEVSRELREVYGEKGVYVRKRMYYPSYVESTEEV